MDPHLRLPELPLPAAGPRDVAPVRAPDVDDTPHVNRVIVGVDGSMGSLEALRYAVAEARVRSANLWSVLVWMPPGGQHPQRGALRVAQERDLARAHLADLRTAWDKALGGVPLDHAIDLLVTCGEPGPALTRIACEPGDLLVLGAPARHSLRRLLTGSTARYCLRHAHCATTVLPPFDSSASGTGPLRGRLVARRIARRMTVNDLRTR